MALTPDPANAGHNWKDAECAENADQRGARAVCRLTTSDKTDAGSKHHQLSSTAFPSIRWIPWSQAPATAASRERD